MPENEPTNEATSDRDASSLGTPSPVDDHGLSLEELSRAYAGLVTDGDDPYQTPDVEGDDPAADGPADDRQPEAVSDDRCEITPRSILEAILFVGTPDNSSLSSKKIASLMRGVRPQEIDQLVEELNVFYDAQNAPYAIASIGAGYQIVLREEFSSFRETFYGRVKEAKLSQQAVDVLAIVAYNQPLTRPEVEQLRARPSGGVLSQLVRRNLLAIQRTADKPPITKYVTTGRFLDLFGLESLEDLPRSLELDRPV